ncbi:MAG: glycoside hydrolase family 3 protein [Candidatus Ventricola sp.]
MNSKWQRINHMPPLPLYPGEPRVTAGAAHIALAREAAAEGMVLLKNEERTLPLDPAAPLAVFGKAQADYVKGGGGSGDVTTAYSRSLLGALEGWNLCAPLSAYYAGYVKEQYAQGVAPGLVAEPPLDDALLAQARAYADTALVTLCRYSSEGADRTALPHDGDFYLSEAEEAMVSKVLAAFDRVVVVLNTGGMMDTSWCRASDSVKAVLLAWQGGIEGGGAMADVLCGRVCPSGRLSDTFAENFDAYPSSEGFGDSIHYVEYHEDIFVGYRYFETIPGAAQKVCYPFGFGLSYTTFAMEDMACAPAGDALRVTLFVRNTGDVAGRQVVQIYGEAPQGKLGKPARVLIGFAKTRTLAPGEREAVIIDCPVRGLASFDDTGAVCRSAWVLEAGDYHVHVGENVRDARPLDFCLHLEEDRVVERCASRCAPQHLTRRMRADGSYEALPMDRSDEPLPYDPSVLPFDGQTPEDCPWTGGLHMWGAKDELPMLIDVAEGRMTLDAFLDSLTLEQQIHLLGGQPNRGIANTFGFGNLPRAGVPNVMTADGPAGLRIQPHLGVCTTAFPCATLLACTWDEALVERVGRAAAEEVRENGIGVWLAPAMNIHRSPLCGRNFEYYSEDPLLAGHMASAMVRGVQSMGVAACIKHFACNNREENRRNCDSRLSERALREIYLRGFELCVKAAHPWSLMTAYNPINGVRASENTDLLTGILREEWGFDGVVTTDWYTYGEQHREVAAGNDIKMGCGMPAHTLARVQDGTLDPALVRQSARRVLELCLRLA